jgi:type IV pilus assembly protein PilA
MTLIELLVVILIIGILAAVALPAFLAQRAKGHDASAKSNARTTVSAMEACYTEVDRYDTCPEPAFGVGVGTLPGQVEITPAGDTYVIVAYSQTGNSFRVTKNADQTVTRDCIVVDPRGGCDGGAW